LGFALNDKKSSRAEIQQQEPSRRKAPVSATENSRRLTEFHNLTDFAVCFNASIKLRILQQTELKDLIYHKPPSKPCPTCFSLSFSKHLLQPPSVTDRKSTSSIFNINEIIKQNEEFGVEVDENLTLLCLMLWICLHRHEFQNHLLRYRRPHSY
jgi:hypothetical protein